MNYLMNWQNRKVLIKKANRTEFKATNVRAKRYRKMRNEVDVLITLHFTNNTFYDNKMILAILLKIRKL